MKKAIFSLVLLATSLSWAEEDMDPPTMEIECILNPIDRSKIHPNSTDSTFQGAPTQYSSSRNWCGYAAATNLVADSSADNTVSYVAGSWIVPQLLATPDNSTCSVWVGIDGYGNGTVEQIGTAHSWENGAQSDYAWFEMYPEGAFEITGFPVKIGDMISARIGYKGNGIFKLVLVNHTKGVSATIPTSYTTSMDAMRATAEWIVEAPWSNGILPLSDFQKITFNYCQATINGKTGAINDGTWDNDAITLEKGNLVEAVPSGLLKNGTCFQVTWKAE